jgi:hypothetical protein
MKPRLSCRARYFSLFAIPDEALSFRAALPRDLSALIAQMNRQGTVMQAGIPM